MSKLQTYLNKVGAMLKPDGDFGPATQQGVFYAQDFSGQAKTGILDKTLLSWLDERTTPYSELDINGIAFIAREETGGLGYYSMFTRWPHYPGYASGITLGVGYDLRFNTEDDFIASWSDFLPEAHIKELTKDIGRRGTRLRTLELKSKGIEIPFKLAWPVFVEQTLPRYYQMTADLFPYIDALPKQCRSALVSLVFNRGASVKGATRREMKDIQSLLHQVSKQPLSHDDKKQALLKVEEYIISMKRLWSAQSGLGKRRQSEANLWRQGLADW